MWVYMNIYVYTHKYICIRVYAHIQWGGEKGMRQGVETILWVDIKRSDTRTAGGALAKPTRVSQCEGIRG